MALFTKRGIPVWQTGPKAHLTSSTTIYTPGELYGSSNPAAICFTCTAANITGTAPPSSSLDGDSSVNNETGDFSTQLPLFSAPAIGGNLSFTLSYDAQSAQATNGYPFAAGSFGYSWTSDLSASLSINYGTPETITVNQANGSEVTFTQSANTGESTSCENVGQAATGDYPTTNKYTMSGSTTQWCALASVEGQFGTIGGNYEFQTAGGKNIEIFNSSGQLTTTTSAADEASPPVVGLFEIYGVPGGTQSTTQTGIPLTQQCPSGVTCNIEYASDGRSIVEEYGTNKLVSAVIDPAGHVYSFTYNYATGQLISVTEPSATTTPRAWNFVYASPGSNLSTANIVEIYDPDANVTSPATYLAGAPHSTSINYYSGLTTYSGMVQSITDGTGATTTYSYSQPCALGQCLALGKSEMTTVTYPTETPCSGTGCTAQSPVQIDQYTGGLETSTQLGSSTNASEVETWSYAWNYGNGTANTSEVITYPNTLNAQVNAGAQPPTATIITDPAGNVISVTNALGDVSTSSYNDVGANNLNELLWTFPGPVSTGASSPPPGSTVYTYNPYGQVTSMTDAVGNVTSYGYYQQESILCYVSPPSAGLSGTPPTCTSSSNNTDASALGAPSGATTYSYDIQGDVISTTLDANDTSASADTQTTASSYDVMGNLLWSIPATGQALSQSASNPYATSTTYSAASVPLVVSAPDGDTTTYTYDPALNVIGQMTPSSTTSTLYDGDNRACYTVTSTSAVAISSCTMGIQAGATATTYVPGGSAPLTVTDSNGYTTTYYYGDLAYPSSPTEIQDQLGAEISYNAYDDFGNVCVSGDVATLSASNQCAFMAGDTQRTYNALGSVLSITNPNGPSDDEITNYYDDAAYPTNLTRTTNGLNQTTQFIYDADGRLKTTINADGSAVTTNYNANSDVCSKEPTSLVYPCGTGPAIAGVSEFAYNDANELTLMSDQVGSPASTTSFSQLTTYTYASGQLISTTDANNKTVSYLYNPAGQVTCEAYPVSPSATCGTLLSPASASTSNTIVNSAYDTSGRLTSTTDWLGNTTVYSYADLTDPTAMTSIQYPASTGLSANYGYDPAGNLTCLNVLRNSSSTTCSSSGGVINDAWTYNHDEQVATSSINGSSSAPVIYNANKQITGATNLGVATSNDSYMLAANGEITGDVNPSGAASGYSFNAGDELCSSTTSTGSSPTVTPCTATPNTGAAYSYNANGERVTATPYSSGNAGASTRYGWNSLGELCSVGSLSQTCGSTPSSGTTVYSYNGMGLRTVATTTSMTTDSTWDTVTGGSLPLNINDASTSSSGTSNNSYLYGNLLFGGTAPVEQINTSSGGATASFIVSAPFGVQGVFSSTGISNQLSTYSPYGVQNVLSGTKVTPFGFQGSYSDSTGLVYLINRYYDPTTDSFLSVDPAVQSTDQAYVFVNGDPLNATDPLGLNPSRTELLWTIDIVQYSPESPSTASLYSQQFVHIIDSHSGQLPGATTSQFFAFVKVTLQDPTAIQPRISNNTLTYYHPVELAAETVDGTIVAKKRAIVVSIDDQTGRIVTAYASSSAKDISIAFRDGMPAAPKH